MKWLVPGLREQRGKILMNDDIIETIFVAIIGLIMAAIYLVLYLAVIIACAWGIELVLDLFDLSIDRTLYWTCVGVLILFCAFGKSKVKEIKE